MSLTQALLPEFDQETANTRKCLERIPEEKLDWKAHEKSWSLREVATHVANLPRWAVMTIQEPSFDVHPVGGAPVREEPVDSVAAAVEMFAGNVAAAREAIATASDEDWLTPWSLLKGGEAIFSLPRIAVVRSFILSHMIHHRAQIGVYLRLNDVSVPALYGPTADEEG